MKFQIRNRFDLSVIFECEAESLGAAVKLAIKARANLSGANLSGADLSGVDLSWVNLSWVNLSRADLSRADLFMANLSRANLSWANLSEAYLFMAKLSEADLFMANLSGANLSRADLSRADLFMANLSFTCVFGLYLGKHFVFGWKKTKEIIIKVGCIEHTAKEWKREFKKIGKKKNYTPKEIEAYGRGIKFIESELKRLK